MSICEEQAASGERGDSKGFQVSNMHSFDSKSGHKRRLKRHNTPDYRLINRYSKGSKQYWKERNRRKQIMMLAKEGLTLGQIAKQLGISSKTAHRDMAKVIRYMKGQINSKRYLLEQERQRELDALDTKTLNQRYNALSKLMFHTQKLSKQEEYERHNKVIVIDLDNLTPDGYPKVLMDKPSSPFKTPYNFSFVARKDGKPHVIGGIKIG